MSKSNVSSFTTRFDQLANHRKAESDDMRAVLHPTKISKFSFTESVNAKIDTLGIDTSVLFDAPQKQIKRFIQFITALNKLEYRNIDRTTAITIYSLTLSGKYPLTTEALRYLGSGYAGEGQSPELRGASRTSIDKLIGSVHPTTLDTQISRTVGKNGFLRIIDAVGGDVCRDKVVYLNNEHSLIVEFHRVMKLATSEQIASLGKSEASES